jgi:hypothetical protein
LHALAYATRRETFMEFIIVRYPTHREVIIDGKPSGFTNMILMVQKGNHQIELTGKIDYRPAKLIVMIKNTDVDFPMKIELVPLEAMEGKI